ncbi:hypothetical protein AB0873_29120 [Micromonospora sp. NPDC047707]|uniref:hypothetical protein n=1 Tax=Micromonospora sp. NPDC047707 TaxID=3154498 RepID=UPI003451DDA8
MIERLKVEYQTLLRLAPHRSVVKVEGADYLDGGEIPYLVFEFIDGQQVDLLKTNRALGSADTVRLGIDVAEADLNGAADLFDPQVRPYRVDRSLFTPRADREPPRGSSDQHF